jgi:hypothetical protein
MAVRPPDFAYTPRPQSALSAVVTVITEIRLPAGEHDTSSSVAVQDHGRRPVAVLQQVQLGTPKWYAFPTLLPSPSGPDIVVQAEQVLRIIGGFDLCQARVVRSVRGLDAIVALIADAQEVDINAAG